MIGVQIVTCRLAKKTLGPQSTTRSLLQTDLETVSSKIYPAFNEKLFLFAILVILPDLNMRCQFVSVVALRLFELDVDFSMVRSLWLDGWHP